MCYSIPMKTTDYIKENGLEALEAIGIIIKHYDKFVVLNYNQLAFDHKFHPVVGECRGLILRKDNWEPLCRPFNRFFNHGEDEALESFQIGASCVWEKIDGTLVSVWWNPMDETWMASTRKMAYAEGPASSGRIFFEVIEEAMGKPIAEFMEHKHTAYTYIFELVSPETRVIKRYLEPELVLTGIRDTRTGCETGPVGLALTGKALGVRVPETYRLTSLSDCIEAAEALPEEDEGYVAAWYRDGSAWRMKVKNPAHVALSKMRNNGAITPKRVCAAIFKGEAAEYLSYFPEDAPLFEPYQAALLTAEYEVGDMWDLYGDMSRKKFAQTIGHLPYSSILFRMHDGKTYEEAFCNTTEAYRYSMLERIVNAESTVVANAKAI